jgi:hypothetical protein
LNDQIADNKQLQETIKQSERKLSMIQQQQRNTAEAISTYSVEVRIGETKDLDLRFP